jgi:hypothetical protein
MAGHLDKNSRDNREASRAAWSLLKNRFGCEEIGDLTGYALNYIVGYLRCRSVLKAGEGGKNITEIMKSLSTDEESRSAEEIVSSFFSALIS